jgi:hypothetical protein
MSPAIHDASARQKSGEPSSPIGQAANRQNAVNAEALSRLPELDLGELRQQWRGLYKTQPPPNLSRELLVRAVAHRMQEVARGNLRSEPRRQLRRIAQQFKEIGKVTIRARPELKPGTRLVRQWQGRTYDVLVLDDGFSWQGTRYRSLSAIARKITGTAWSGPLFFGLKSDRPATRSSPASDPTASGGEALLPIYSARDEAQLIRVCPTCAHIQDKAFDLHIEQAVLAEPCPKCGYHFPVMAETRDSTAVFKDVPELATALSKSTPAPTVW